MNRLSTLVGVAALVCASACAAAHAAERTIYRCPGDDGPTFTDLPCADGRAVELAPTTTVEMPVPEARHLPARVERNAGVVAPLAGGRPPQADGARRCSQARERLDEVRATKRHGYKASRALALDERERRYAAQVERECGS